MVKKYTILDKLDFKILKHLIENCRDSDRFIGSKIGLTGPAVKRRIEKMKQKGTISNFTLNLEPSILGYVKAYVIIKGKKTGEIQKQVSLIGEPFLIIPCIGNVTIYGIVTKEDISEKIETLQKMLNNSQIITVYKTENQESDFSPTKTDLEILAILLEDPQIQIEKIAKQTGLSTKTIARALEKFHAHFEIQFTCICNPKKMDGHLPYSVAITINNNQNKTKRKLEKEFSEYFLNTPFVSKNQIVLFMYNENIFEIDEIVNKIHEMANIKNVDMFMPKQFELPLRWAHKRINSLRQSPKLHLTQHMP
ncbi:AsnC family transcriptional regulator [archaeon]|nr:AsnC family transcriptional regulator [archaeon]